MTGALLATLLLVLPAEVRNPVVIEANAGVRYNPLGAATSVRVTLRQHLIARESRLRSTQLGNTLLEPTSVGVATHTELTPAYLRTGVGVEATPAAFWRMRATWQGFAHFGTFNGLMSFDDRRAHHDPASIRERARTGRHHGPAISQRVILENLLQMRIWRLVAADQATAEGWSAHRKGWFYSGEYDLLMDGTGDVALKNILVVGLGLGMRPRMPEMVVGGFHAFTRVLRSEGQNQQAGLAILHTPVMDAWWLTRAGLIILAGIHLQDRYKTGQPYFAAQVSVTL
ncbi:MAG: hypothetical protein AB2A00_17115 [Myxococcota bacterium]